MGGGVVHSHRVRTRVAWEGGGRGEIVLTPRLLAFSHLPPCVFEPLFRGFTLPLRAPLRLCAGVLVCCCVCAFL